MIKIGIVGLPNAGKSTLFKALTKRPVAIANYPFTTIEPNVAVVAVSDHRLDHLADAVKPTRVVPPTIEFVDIAGLVKGAHQGQGLGNQFLSHIYAVDAILLLVRCFKDPNIVSLVENPQEQISIIKEELTKKDESTTDPHTPLLSCKPALIVGNVKSGGENTDCGQCALKLDAQLELEISELTEKETQELALESALPQLIALVYQTLDLITFYTVKGGKELRAWPIKKGALAPQAGGRVHSDFEEKFIRAEVLNWQELTKAGSWAKARETGFVRTEGKDYVMQDGDVVEFKI